MKKRIKMVKANEKTEAQKFTGEWRLDVRFCEAHGMCNGVCRWYNDGEGCEACAGLYLVIEEEEK